MTRSNSTPGVREAKPRTTYDENGNQRSGNGRVPRRRKPPRSTVTSVTAVTGQLFTPEEWSDTDLMTTDFPPPRWAIPGVIPVGATLIVGAPKIGKSWLSLNLVTAVARGEPALGGIEVQQGSALYVALEDSPRRLKARMSMLNYEPNGKLSVWMSCPPVEEGGGELISKWIEQHPDTRLVVIDVLVKMRTPATNTPLYQADYALMSSIKEIADRHDIAIAVVHHSNRAQHEDFIDSVNGTNGLAGAADTIAVIKRMRGQADAKLHVTGRDVEDFEAALDFNLSKGGWRMLDGPAIEHAISDTRATILRCVRENPGITPKQIAEKTGLGHDLVRQTVKRMADDGQLHAGTEGRYSTIKGPGDTESDTCDRSDRKSERRPPRRRTT